MRARKRSQKSPTFCGRLGLALRMGAWLKTCAQCWICQIFPRVPSPPSSFPSPPLPLPPPSPFYPFLVPPLPFSFPPLFPSHPSLPSLSLLPLFPSPPLPPLEVGPLFAAKGCGGALKLPYRVRAEPGRQTFSGAF